MPHATSPRIPPLALDEMDAEQRRLARLGADTVIQVLARTPELMQASSALGGFLLAQGKLPARLRELVILRVALRCDAPYEWANHLPAALGAGASEAEVDALSDSAARWAPADDAVLRAVDEICDDVFVSDRTWADLSATHDDPEVIELLFLVGYYRMMAGFLNSAGVAVKADQPGLGERAETTRPPIAHEVPAAHVNSGKTGPDGTWNITFAHPAGNRELVLTLDTTGGTVAGSILDNQVGVTVPITGGTVEGNQLTCTAELTEPARVEISVQGMIDGDTVTGSVTAAGLTFSFSGTRAA
ncbi:carboxymuconolactone decarboxylase family protein [Nocardiopsis oceani]